MKPKNPNAQAVLVLHDKLIEAEARAAGWLGDGNEASERGNQVKAEKCYNKAQFWHDRANKLRGWA